MHIERARGWLWLALLVGVLSAGCPGTLEDKQSFVAYAAAHPDAAAGAGAAPPDAMVAGAATAPPDPDGCGDVVTRIFVPTCGGTGCHGAAASQQGLDLVSPGVAARLVGVSGTTCLQTLVDPQNPEASLLYQKLLPLPACGAQMPLARPPLSSADLACVRDWIAAQ